MTVEQEKTPAETSQDGVVDSPVASRTISRRALLRGAGAAVPTIMTLHSGAALAASSNLIGTNEFTPVQTEYGGTPCVNASTTDGMPQSGVYDLGQTPIGEVNVIPEGVTFRTAPNNGSNSAIVSHADMCYRGPGPFHYHDGVTWKSVTVPQGGLASATALSSFANAPGVIVQNLLDHY